MNALLVPLIDPDGLSASTNTAPLVACGRLWTVCESVLMLELMLANAALRPETCVIGRGSAIVEPEPDPVEPLVPVQPVPVPVVPPVPVDPPPPLLPAWRTWLKVSGVVLGGTCHVSLHEVNPSLLLYVAVYDAPADAVVEGTSKMESAPL